MPAVSVLTWIECSGKLSVRDAFGCDHRMAVPGLVSASFFVIGNVIEFCPVLFELRQNHSSHRSCVVLEHFEQILQVFLGSHGISAEIRFPPTSALALIGTERTGSLNRIEQTVQFKGSDWRWNLWPFLRNYATCGSEHRVVVICLTCFKKVRNVVEHIQQKFQDKLGLELVDKEVVMMYDRERDEQPEEGKNIVEMKTRLVRYSKNLLSEPRSSLPIRLR